MAGGDAGVSDLNTGGCGSGAITTRVAAFSDVPAGAHRGTAGLAPSVLVSALARLDVVVERELRPGRLSLFFPAGPGTLGRIALDLRKCAGGSLAGFGIARRSCGRPAGGPAYKSPRASSWLSGIPVVGAFSDLFARLDPDPRVRGKQFEHVCKWFLTNDPIYKHELRRVWLWDEWPGRWGGDAGIDLVAEDRDGQLVGDPGQGVRPRLPSHQARREQVPRRVGAGGVHLPNVDRHHRPAGPHRRTHDPGPGEAGHLRPAQRPPDRRGGLARNPLDTAPVSAAEAGQPAATTSARRSTRWSRGSRLRIAGSSSWRAEPARP